MPAYGGWGAPGGIVAAANVGVALVEVSAFSPYQYAPYDYYYGTDQPTDTCLPTCRFMVQAAAAEGSVTGIGRLKRGDLHHP